MLMNLGPIDGQIELKYTTNSHSKITKMTNNKLEKQISESSTLHRVALSLIGFLRTFLSQSPLVA